MGSQDELKLIISAQDRAQQAILSTSNGLKYLEGTVTRLSVQLAAFSAAWSAGMAVIQKAMHYIDLGAQALKAEESFKSMADAAGVNAERLTTSMKKAADGFVDDSHLMQKAAFAMAQDIDPEKIPQLFEAARVASRKTGQDVTTSIDGMIQSISTNMPRSLRQMGMITKEQMNLLNQAMAAGINEVNLLDLVLANAAVDSAKFGASANNAAKDLARFKVQCEELKEEAGKLLTTVLQKLIGLFQSLAASVLGAAAAYHSFRASMLESDLEQEQSLGWPYGDKDEINDLKRRIEEQKRFAKEAREAALGLAAKSYDNLWGGVYTDTRTKEQKEKAIADAEARRTALEEEIRRQTAAAKDKEKAESARAAWAQALRAIQADIEKLDLEPLEQHLVEIVKKVEELREKAAKLPDKERKAAEEQIGRIPKVAKDKKTGQWKYEDWTGWVKAVGEGVVSEQAKKDFEEWLKTQQDIEQYTKDQAARSKAIREGEINEQLAELDIAEKLGTAHRDTIEERIRLSEELLDIQEEYLDALDKDKDPASWYAQKNAIDSVRKSLADLYREQLMNNPFEAMKLSMKDLENEWTDTGKQMYNLAKETAQSMQSAFSDFFFDAMDLKLKSLADYVRSFLTGVQKSIAQTLGQQVIGAAIYGVGDLASLITWAGPGSGFHTGGRVGGPASFYRLVPAAALTDLLPRRHGGGLAPDERLTINRVGERYVTEEQNSWLTGIARAMTRGTDQGEQSIIHNHFNINAVDAKSFEDLCRRNPQAVVSPVMQSMRDNRTRKEMKSLLK